MKLRKMIVLALTAAMLAPVMPVMAAGDTGEDVKLTEDNILPYLDTSLSFEERAADLVSRMTLEEKVSQLGYKAAAIERLGVKEYDYWKEALHGVARQGKATSFPTALSLSNTWNRDLIYRVADIISTEARGKNNRYNLSYWSPTVNMARDPRWGRNEETYGEDPYLTAELGAEFVKGMQGDDEKYLKTIATLKHFAANNNEKNRSSGSSMMSEFNLRNYYTRVFQNITERVMPASIMSSYNATTITRNGANIYNFIPSLANSYLLQDLLRCNWGFDGYVTSDCGAGQYMSNNSAFKQGMLGTDTLPIEQYVAEFYKNGLNVECNLSGGNWSTAYGVAAVKNGYLSEEELERAVYELFLQRFRTGEFDDGAAYQDITSSVIETDENVAVAEEAAEESWVLLKNDDMLPLKANSTENIVVVGNLANALLLGDYTGSPTKLTYPVDGITASAKRLNPNAKITHLGAVSNTEILFNVKSITLVLRNGQTRSVDLSKAESVTGMTKSGSTFTSVTPAASAVIKNVNFQDVVTVRVEMSTGDCIGGSLDIAYGSGGPGVATINSVKTSSLDTYTVCEGEYTGADGGYDGTVDMYISAGSSEAFSVEKNKAELDAADVIIAYAGTVPKQTTFGVSGTVDSSESKDRDDINLPATQAHVQSICDNYSDKTVVVMSTVGQMNVEPFKDKCRAILWTSYNGQTQGDALGKVLTGEVNPSGRLTTTWYKNADISKMELAGTTKKTIGGINGNYTDYNIQTDGTNPGHTYQYYANTPIYPFGYGQSYTSFEYSNVSVDKTSVDANGTVTITADIKNAGTVKGKEVVQLYVSHPNSGTGTMPKKQLKNFEKVELESGETKTVTLTLNVRDMYLFDEASQKDIVPTGTYTAYIAKNADDTANAVTFTVTGTLASTIKTVKAIPNGVSVKGLICEDGTGLTPVTRINSNLSAVMSDEAWLDLKDAQVVYTSSDSDVASVDENGIVTSGAKEGVAVITASVTADGVTKSDAYPVVNKLEIKPSDDEIDLALAQLKAEYDGFVLFKNAYSDNNWNEIEKIYANGINEIKAALTKAELEEIISSKINNMRSVVMDNLSANYEITSQNPEIIKNGVIDYSNDGGIPMYSGAQGTITEVSPYSGIKLEVKDANDNVVDNSKLTWQLGKLDGSSRKVADIDSETGELTIYGNGIIQITAANAEDMTCGRLTVHVNMQIEGEYADDDGGADLTDNQSGSSGGHDAGSTANAWIEYKSVKLLMLEGITVRYAGKNAGTINISLDKSTAADKLIGSVTPKATGAWATWDNAEIELNSNVLKKAQEDGLLDKYGCATVYVQTNGVNLDYFRLNYLDSNDEAPYLIEKVTSKDGGAVKANIKYRGTVDAKDVAAFAAVYEGDMLKKVTKGTVCGSGEYEIAAGASDGDKVKLFIWNSLDGLKPFAESVETVYKTPVESEIVVYTLDDTKFDYAAQTATGASDGTQFAYELNGLNGYGGWTIVNKEYSYTYTDTNEKTYDYTFKKTWQAGTGGQTKRSLYFTPKSACKVTVVFSGASGRDMYIEQNGNKLTGIGVDGQVTVFSLETADCENSVYVYGGNSNKQLHAIIVEYYGAPAELSADNSGNAVDRPVQIVEWGNSKAILTKHDTTGETKIYLQSDISRTQLDTGYFYESDVPYEYDDEYKINSLAVYNDRLYAGCDNGLVILFTSCVKCYKLKKLADFDIKSLKIENDSMILSDGEQTKTIDMSTVGARDIEAFDAEYMINNNGAVLVDLRDEADFADKHYEGAVNIQPEDLEAELDAYSRDTAVIFCCYSGMRCEKALLQAKEMGFNNVYNLGSADKLI